MRIFFTAIAVSMLVISCNTPQKPEPQEPINPLLGSWQVKSIHWITPDTTYSINEAQPGLLMINPSRYSIMWTPTQAPRTPFENLSNPTDEELKTGFRSIVFNAGTYVYTDSTLTTTAEIAKVPGFEGGTQYYRYNLSGNQLEITMFDETYPDGKKPDWFGKVESKFVLEKL